MTRLTKDVTAGKFREFPEFTQLTLSDRDAYAELVRGYPTVSDIAFESLMTWWNPLGDMSIAVLNDNLVIPYRMPDDEDRVGLSLVGTNNVDESVCTIFDYLTERNQPARLVNVPEFVVMEIEHAELFRCIPDRRNDEYIYSVDRFYPLEKMAPRRRKRVEKAMQQHGKDHVVTLSLDLEDEAKRTLLLAAYEVWQAQGINDYGEVERASIKSTISHATELGVQNVCLFVNGELYGFCMYRLSNDKRFVDMDHIKATHEASLSFEFISYMFAKWFAERGVAHINLGSDSDMPALRTFMVALGPSNFLRKYILEPAT